MKNINFVFYGLIFTICSYYHPMWGGNDFFVDDMRGSVFAMLQGKTWYLKPKDKLQDFSEIISEVDGNITFSDSSQRKYQLSGGGQLKILNQIIELKNGYLWIKSTDEKIPLTIMTANSITTIMNGELILSFDNKTGKSQVMTLKNSCLFSNVLEKDIQERVHTGEFSFISKDYNGGRPRPSTPVSYDSFKQLTAIFSHNAEETKEHKEHPETALKAKLSDIKKDQRKVLYIKAENEQDKLLKLKQFNQKTLEEVQLELKKYEVPSWAKKSKVHLKVFGNGRKGSQKKNSMHSDSKYEATTKALSERPADTQRINQLINELSSQKKKDAIHESH